MCLLACLNKVDLNFCFRLAVSDLFLVQAGKFTFASGRYKSYKFLAHNKQFVGCHQTQSILFVRLNLRKTYADNNQFRWLCRLRLSLRQQQQIIVLCLLIEKKALRSEEIREARIFLKNRAVLV